MTIGMRLGLRMGSGGGGYTGITPAFTASVTTGVAPLGVLLDSTGTTSVTTSTPFKDLLFGFDSGDSDAATATYGTRAGQSKRRRIGGPTWGYVYTTPGTRSASGWAYDGVGFRLTSITIVVQDPDVVFSGANTICCSTSGNFTGAPSGSDNQTVANLAAAQAFIASGKRVLLQAADTWTSAATYTLNATRDVWQFGSFNGQAVITASGTHFCFTVSTATITRGTFLNLDYNGASTSQGFFAVNTAIRPDRITLSNVYAYDLGSLVTTNGTGCVDNMTMHKVRVERVVGGAGKVGIYGAYTNLVLDDWSVNDATAGEHCVRFPYVGKGWIGNGYASNPAATKHALTLRAPAFAGGAVVGLAAGSYTEYVTIAENQFSSNTAQIVTITPQGTANDERIRRCIFERNYVYTLNTGSNTGLTITAIDVISRNNVYNCTGGGNNPGAVAIARNETFISTGIESQNDTLYRLGNHNGMTFFSVIDSIALGPPTGSAVKNGLIYSPGTGTVTPVNLNGGAAVVTNTNTTTGANAKTVNPLFSGALTAFEHFTLGASSPYATFAVLDKNYSDALDKIRVSNGGAHMLASNATSAWTLVGG